jgi:DNA adenine methylase
MAGIQPQRFPSPLRYPGGKGKIANFIKLIMIQNDLVGCEYIEPYAGGASVALILLFEEYADHIHINDLNRSVYAFWTSVLEDTDEFCRMVNDARIDVTEWKRQREIQNLSDPDRLELGFSTFYLNRTSRSGIIGGGMIGGKDQKGPWKLDARFNRKDLISRIEKIGRFRNRISVTGIDTADYLRTQLQGVEHPFLYLDPPYYIKGAGLYENFYRHEDHVEIATLVGKLIAPWIVSYDSVPEIAAMYRDFPSISYGLQYSAADRHLGSERMYFSSGFTLPSVQNPANVPVELVHRVRSIV